MRFASTRRDFLRVSAGGLLASMIAPLRGLESPRRRAKSCILLWMEGGPSHVDTWDLKSGNGPFQPIATTIPALRISEHLPRLAREARHLAVIRSLTSREADHARATYLLHTGNTPKDDSVTFPTLGAVASREWPPSRELPSFVLVGEPTFCEPGFLGREHAPFTVLADASGEVLELPEEVRPRFERRRRILDGMNQEFAGKSDRAGVMEEAAIQARTLAMMGPKAVAAFDLEQEPESSRAAYGDSSFGRGCLLARRLVEHGVPFVEVVLGGWDTHKQNFAEVKKLSSALDPAMSSLIRELEERGLLDETLVIWMGEFGRSAAINATEGRDHQSSAFSAVLAGGGIAGGQVIGRTDEAGKEVVERPVTVPDLFASAFHAFGFDGGKEYEAAGRRPVRLVEDGEVVSELFRS